MSSRSTPVLSLIICSRNDDYMGDPMWRLATSINYVSEQIFAIGKEESVEILVADWGSKTPISEVIELSQRSVAITHFINIPKPLADELQQDSPFAEVYALNIAARRSEGLYIGRIDQDTLVTKTFLKHFFDIHDGVIESPFDLENSYMFAVRKQLPFSLVKKKPSIRELDRFIKLFGKLIFREELPFYQWASPVGILMMHRNMWEDVGGYDERLIYYWHMDVDLGTRLIKKYPIIDIDQIFGYNFFHLEHFRHGFKIRRRHRRLNPEWSKSFDKPILNPNGADWGLAKEHLPRTQVSKAKVEDELWKERVTSSYYFVFSSYLKMAAKSSLNWGYHYLRYLWFISKKLRKKPLL